MMRCRKILSTCAVLVRTAMIFVGVWHPGHCKETTSEIFLSSRAHGARLCLTEVGEATSFQLRRGARLHGRHGGCRPVGSAARSRSVLVVDAMKHAIDETRRRRRVQEEYHREHGITPETIRKSIRSGIEAEVAAHRQANAAVGRVNETEYVTQEYINELEAEMLAAARKYKRRRG